MTHPELRNGIALEPRLAEFRREAQEVWVRFNNGYPAEEMGKAGALSELQVRVMNRLLAATRVAENERPDLTSEEARGIFSVDRDGSGNVIGVRVFDNEDGTKKTDGRGKGDTYFSVRKLSPNDEGAVWEFSLDSSFEMVDRRVTVGEEMMGKRWVRLETEEYIGKDGNICENWGFDSTTQSWSGSI